MEKKNKDILITVVVILSLLIIFIWSLYFITDEYSQECLKDYGEAYCNSLESEYYESREIHTNQEFHCKKFNRLTGEEIYKFRFTNEEYNSCKIKG